MRQIHGAIEHLYKGEFECAITLAGAAEGQSSDQSDEALFAQLKVCVPPEFRDEKEWIACLNAVRDWLKHPALQWGDEWNIAEYDAVAAGEVSSASSSLMSAACKWARARHASVDRPQK